MRRPALLLVALLALAATACGVNAESEPEFTPDRGVPFQLLESAPPTAAPPTTVLAAASDICLARDAVLVPTRRPATSDPSPRGTSIAAPASVKTT